MSESRSRSSRESQSSALALYCLIACVSLGFCIRLLVGLRSGLWRDEALCLFVARLPHFTDTLTFLQLHESHPPLYYALLRGWTFLFGTSETSLVLTSAFFGAVTVAAVFYAAHRVFGLAEACLAGVISSVSPELLEFGTQVRPYGMLQALTVISCFSLWLIRRKPELKLWLLYTLCAVMMVYSHNWAWLTVAAQAVCYLISITAASWKQGRDAWRKQWLQDLAQGTGALLAIVVFYLPWLPTLLMQGKTAGHGGISPSQLKDATLTVIFSSSDILTPWRRGVSQNKAALIWFTIAALTIAGILLYRRKQNVAHSTNIKKGPRAIDNATLDAVLFFGGVFWVALAMAAPLSLKNNLLQYKCTSMLLPGLDVLWAGSLVYFSRWAGPQNVNKSSRQLFRLSLCVTFCLILFSVAYQDLKLWRTPKSSAREYASYIGERAQPDDLILIAPPWYCSSFNWYYDKPTSQITYPNFEATQAMPFSNLVTLYNDPVKYEKVVTALKQHAARGKTVWMLTTPDISKTAPVAPSEILPSQHRDSWTSAGNARARQLYEVLCQAYGKQPERVALMLRPNDDTDSMEFEVERFSK